MAIKFDITGLLSYAAMAAWLAALGMHLFRAKQCGNGFFAAGFAILVGAFAARWVQVQHPPLQSMFEVFLCLGMLTYPLWLFCHRLLGAGSPAGAMVIGIIVMFPVGFVFSAEPQNLPPALQSWLFIPHVAAYMLAYMILAMASVHAMMQLFAAGPARAEAAAARELATYNMVRLGFPLLTLGLVLGAVWGRIAWGSYWNWDPKELWSLATVMAYLTYLHFRATFGTRFARINAALAIIGLALIVITLVWVNLAVRFSGMHGYAK